MKYFAAVFIAFAILAGICRGFTSPNQANILAYVTGSHLWHSGTEAYSNGNKTQSSGVEDSAKVVCDCPATFKDIDGNVYHGIRIGKQCWMAENLKTTHYRDSSAITEIEDSIDWSNKSVTTAAWCYYGYNGVNNAVYGKLYSWPAISDKRKIAPAGWHVPSDAEVTAMINFLGGADVAGDALKSISTLWIAPNTEATNSSGFAAVPGGYRLDDSDFDDYGTGAYFWTSTGFGTANAWLLTLKSNSASANMNYFGIVDGMSCRCIKDP